MDPVIIMVGRPNEGVSDIEIMPNIAAEELADAIAAALGWDGVYDIQINGEILGGRQTLADVNAWDGSELLMVASSRQPREKKQQRNTANFRVLQTSSQAEKEGWQADEIRSPLPSVAPGSSTYTLLSTPAEKSDHSSRKTEETASQS